MHEGADSVNHNLGSIISTDVFVCRIVGQKQECIPSGYKTAPISFTVDNKKLKTLRISVSGEASNTIKLSTVFCSGGQTPKNYDRKPPNIPKHHCHVREIPVCVADWVVLWAVDVDGFGGG